LLFLAPGKAYHLCVLGAKGARNDPSADPAGNLAVGSTAVGRHGAAGEDVPRAG
jgi:hypothetical protein